LVAAALVSSISAGRLGRSAPGVTAALGRRVGGTNEGGGGRTDAFPILTVFARLGRVRSGGGPLLLWTGAPDEAAPHEAGAPPGRQLRPVPQDGHLCTCASLCGTTRFLLDD
jgi:hypothetical protein